MNQDRDYYVYAGYSEGELVYIGRGSGNRKLHLNSGVSHVYEANKLHFLGKQVEIKIIKDKLDLNDSKQLEKFEIIKNTPKWNVVHSTNNTVITAMNQGAAIKKALYNMTLTVKYTKLPRYVDDLFAIIKYIKIHEKQGKKVTLNSLKNYNKGGSCLHWYLYKGSRSIKNYTAYFPEKIREVFNIEFSYSESSDKNIWYVNYNEDLLLKYYTGDSSVFFEEFKENRLK